jgi:hypothetical protein
VLDQAPLVLHQAPLVLHQAPLSVVVPLLRDLVLGVAALPFDLKLFPLRWPFVLGFLLLVLDQHDLGTIFDESPTNAIVLDDGDWPRGPYPLAFCTRCTRNLVPNCKLSTGSTRASLVFLGPPDALFLGPPDCLCLDDAWEPSCE